VVLDFKMKNSTRMLDRKLMVSSSLVNTVLLLAKKTFLKT